MRPLPIGTSAIAEVPSRYLPPRIQRYIISYEPYNFKGHVTDFPLTLEYGKKMDALRKRYRAWIWDAEFRDTLGAKVTAAGQFRYTVFNNADQKRAVVVVNLETTKSIAATLDIPHPNRLVSVTPENPEPQHTSGYWRFPLIRRWLSWSNNGFPSRKMLRRGVHGFEYLRKSTYY
jgi:hypothetical protein